MMEASNCKCIKCDKQAEVFWPAFDPDIKSYPYCRKCVEEEKIQLLMDLARLDDELET